MSILLSSISRHAHSYPSRLGGLVGRTFAPSAKGRCFNPSQVQVAQDWLDRCQWLDGSAVWYFGVLVP